MPTDVPKPVSDDGVPLSGDRPWLLYGAYGYTGRLIAREAVARGLTPVLAGRDRRKTEALARELDLEPRAFGLDDPVAIRRGIAGAAAVLHAAGPFIRTYRPLAEACLAAGAHYLDITGEIDVFEALAALDGRAREAGVALLPGVGFDVVPTDCAAARAASGVVAPQRLEIAFAASGGVSRGTARTMLLGITEPPRERRDGRIVPAAGPRLRRIPFSDRERLGLCGSWGDVATAFHSTGVPNVRAYLPASERQLRRMRLARPLLALGPLRRLAAWWVGRTVDGPGERELAEGWARVWCEASGAGGETAVTELVTPNGYALTADAAVTAVQRLLASREAPAGFLTPSLAFGADFVDGLRGVRRVQG